MAVVLTHAIVRGPIEATIRGHHIDYRVDLWHGGALVFFYVVATCGSLLSSQREHVRWFGAANLVVACALAWLNKSGLISLWCFWAAITSAADLLRAVWGTSYDAGSNTVDVVIRSLRKKLGAVADRIETVRGVGHRLR